MAFDPDAYLKEKSVQASPAFDPDNYIAQKSPESQSLFKRGLAFIGDQLERVPGAIKGYAQAVQDNDVYNAPNLALKGFVDPSSVQSSTRMMERAGFSSTPKQNIKRPPPGPIFNFKTNDFTPAQQETTYVSPAQVAGAGFDNLAPTGLELIPGVAALLKGGAKYGIKGIAGAADAVRGTSAASDFVKGTEQGIKAYKARQAAHLDEVFNPKLAGDATKMKQVGEALGFTPEEIKHPSIEFGQNSVQARRNKVLSQGEGGAPYLERHNTMTDKLQKGFDNAVFSIGNGHPLDPVPAGELIRDGVKSGAKRIADNVSATHADIMEQFPGLMVNGQEMSNLESKVNGLEKFAKGRSERGLTKEQQGAAKALLNAVDAIRNSNGSYKQLNEAREMIGEIAFDDIGSLNKIPTYEQKMRDMYFSINDALINTVGKTDRVRAGQFKKVGENFTPLKEQLIQSNETLHKLFQDEGALGRSIGKDGKGGDEIFNQALLYGNTEKIKALKSILKPEEFDKLKASYLNALVKKGKEGFTYKQALNSLASNRSVLGELFADSPEKLQAIKSIMELGDRIGAPVLPGSSGQLDFGGANSLSKIVLDKITAPVGDITAEIGKQRAASGSSLRDLVGKKQENYLSRFGSPKGRLLRNFSQED